MRRDTDRAMTALHGGPPVKHLHNYHELTFKLMDDPTRWRERVVEKIVIEDADDVRVTSSYQIRLPLGLVQEVWPSCGSGDLVRILLPLTTRPKGVLLDVDLKGTEGHHCALLLKHQLARLQANFVLWVANAPPGETLASMDADEVLYAISAYSPAIWNQHVAELRNESPQTLAEYLKFGLRLDVRLDDVRHWSELVAPASELLAASMGTPIDLQSAVVHVPRCLPFVEHRPATVDDVSDWLGRFCLYVESVDARTRSIVAAYGQRWDVMIDTVVPVDVPTKIQLGTKRPWHDVAVERPARRRAPGVITQRVMLGDAQSGHVEVHLVDHGARIVGPPEVVDTEGSVIGIPRVDALRMTDDKLSIYVAGEDAPAYVDLSVRLRLRTPMHWLLWLLTLAAAASLPLVVAADSTVLLDESAALLLLPLAGAVLLARPATGAAERLQRRLRGALVGTVALILLVLTVRLTLAVLLSGDEVSAKSGTACPLATSTHDVACVVVDGVTPAKYRSE